MNPKRERPTPSRPEPGLQVDPPPQAAAEAVLAFEVAGRRFGLSVSHVIQIVEMVAMTHLPGAPEVVAGVVNFHGRVIPLFDLKRRLNLPREPYTLRTPIVISRVGEHVAGLVVDRVHGVVAMAGEQAQPLSDIFGPETLPSLPLLRGVAQQSDGMLLILDLGSFLSREEERALYRALDDPQDK